MVPSPPTDTIRPQSLASPGRRPLAFAGYERHELDDLDPVLLRPFTQQPQGLIEVPGGVDEQADAP